MVRKLRVSRRDGLEASWLARASRAALDRPLGAAAELLVAVPSDEALVLGALQRVCEVPPGFATSHLERRGSGGGLARVGPGSVWMQLALARTDALVAAGPEQLLNRYVRPVLRALTRSGAPAHYFGRDWIAVGKRPAATMGFAHDASSGRALVEVIVAVSTPMWASDRASFMGKAPVTLVESAPRATPAGVADALVAAYREAYDTGAERVDLADAPSSPGPAPDEPPWTATRDEAIGLVAAGRDREGRVRLGGELMASRDAVARLEEAVARGEDPGRATNEALAAPGVVTFGVRDLASVRDVLALGLATREP